MAAESAAIVLYIAYSTVQAVIDELGDSKVLSKVTFQYYISKVLFMDGSYIGDVNSCHPVHHFGHL